MMSTIPLLGVHVSAVNLNVACAHILRWVKERARVYICCAPVSTLVDAERLPGYRRVVNEAAMVTPDGMPVVWLMRLYGAKKTARTYGPDLMMLVCDQGQSVGMKHFLLGSTEETLERLKLRLLKLYPNIQIAGSLAPQVSLQDVVSPDNLIQVINQARADVVWVALGSPKQDFWMHQNRNRIESPVLVGVGAAFDFLSGVKSQAPLWMQRSGLEWLYRLCSEPRRLWKRYLFGNSLFIYYLIKEKICKNTSAT